MLEGGTKTLGLKSSPHNKLEDALQRRRTSANRRDVVRITLSRTLACWDQSGKRSW